MENFMKIYQNEIQIIAGSPLPWEKLEGKTVMISGATGMIGKCLIDILMARNEITGGEITKNKTTEKMIKVIALSRSEERAKERLGEYWEKDTFRYVTCDVNAGIPECGQAEYLIHAASNTHPLQYAQDSIGTIASNVIGTKNMLDYAVAHGAEHFCFVSSVEIYGENRGDTEKFDESYLGYIDCNTLRAGYPESKRLGETLCHAYAHTYGQTSGQAPGLTFVIPRLSRIYGPTMLSSDSKAISQFIRKAAAGEDIVLKSEGNQKYSYTFVTDAASGILYSMLLGAPGEAYNVADAASDITLKELAGELAAIAGTKVIFELPDEVEKKGYSTATKAMLDASKLENTGWTPRIHMKEGLYCAVEAIRLSNSAARFFH